MQVVQRYELETIHERRGLQRFEPKSQKRIGWEDRVGRCGNGVKERTPKVYRCLRSLAYSDSSGYTSGNLLWLPGAHKWVQWAPWEALEYKPNSAMSAKWL